MATDLSDEGDPGGGGGGGARRAFRKPDSSSIPVPDCAKLPEKVDTAGVGPEAASEGPTEAEAAAEAGELLCGGRQGQLPGHPEDAASLRSLLLLHFHLHERSHRLPLESPRTLPQALSFWKPLPIPWKRSKFIFLFDWLQAFILTMHCKNRSFLRLIKFTDISTLFNLFCVSVKPL